MMARTENFDHYHTVMKHDICNVTASMHCLYNVEERLNELTYRQNSQLTFIRLSNRHQTKSVTASELFIN